MLKVLNFVSGKKDTTEDLQKRLDELSIINKMSIALSSGQDLYHLLRLLLEELKKLFVMDEFYIGIYNPETETVTFPIYFTDNQFLEISPRNLREQPGLTGAVIFSEKTLYIPDQTDPEVIQRYQPLDTGQRRNRSYIGIPLMLNNTVIGILSVQSIQPDIYTSQQIQLLETIAAQSAFAIEKARLFSELQEELAERERSEQALRESESKLRAIIENVPFDMWVSDRDNRYMMQSGESYRLAGDIIGKTPDEIGISPEIVAPWWEDYRRAMKGETVNKEVAWEVMGELRDFITTLAPVKDKENVIGYIGINLDITERKRAEEALRQSETIYRKAIEVAGAVPYRQTYKEGHIIVYDFIGKGIQEITKYEPEEFNEEVWESLVQEIHLFGNLANYSLEEAIARVRTGLDPIWQCEYRILDRNGEARWVYEAAVELRNNDGISHGSIGLFQDITKRKQAEEVIHQREAILGAIAFAAEQFFKTTDWRANINIILERLGKVIDCTHVYIFENLLNQDNRPISHITYEWTADGFHSDLGNETYQNVVLPDDRLDYWYELLSNNEPFVSSSPLLPDNEREQLNARGIKAMVDVPIFVNGKWWGIIGFDDMVKEREWSAAELDALRVASNVFGAAIQRQLAEEEIHRINSELENRVEQRTTQLQEANLNLSHEKVRLEKYNRQRELMADMTDLLQASLTMEEASQIISTHLKLLFPNQVGALYLVTPSNTFEPVSTWGEEKSLDVIYGTNDCWGLRRGKPYRFGAGSPNPPCAHVREEKPFYSLCIPLSAQGESIGNLHIATRNNQDAEFVSEEEQRFIETIADSISLAIANLRLREKLHYEAIRDPLTGLFNRRYLDETLPREIHRAERSKRPISVLMFDIDHFKKFNDTFGHDAGDVVLKSMAGLMVSGIRDGDIACRYGGEEFTIILPDTPIEVATRRAENLRYETSIMELHHNGQTLGTVTISIGVATYPQHGVTRDALIKSADEASYEAKETGRNRVVVCQ